MMNFAEMRKVAWNTIVEALNLDNPDDAHLIFQAKTYTVDTLPEASDYPRGVVYVSDETGGAVLAFSDGSDWRRVTDRAVVS